MKYFVVSMASTFSLAASGLYFTFTLPPHQNHLGGVLILLGLLIFAPHLLEQADPA